MKKIVSIFIGCFLLVSIVYSQQVYSGDIEAESEIDTLVNFGWGIYKVCPLLSHDEKIKTINKIEFLENEVHELEQEILQSKESLTMKLRADSLHVRRHFTFFGGAYTIPKLTASEKKALKVKKRLDAEKVRIEKEELKVSQLKLDKSRLEKLLQSNKKKLRKSYLWDFAITTKDRVKADVKD